MSKILKKFKKNLSDIKSDNFEKIFKKLWKILGKVWRSNIEKIQGIFQGELSEALKRRIDT